MMHEQRKENGLVEGSSNRSFGLVFTLFFAIIAFLPYLHQAAIRYWALALSVIILNISILAPRYLTVANKAWQTLGLLLGKITTPIVMGLLFYFIMTPMAIVRGKKRRQALALDWDNTLASYWIRREPAGPDPKTLNQQF